MPVPVLRIQSLNAAPVRATGQYVVYWMIAQRRTTWNFGLQRAIEHARQLQKPLLIFEALRVGYRWASDRLHKFVIDGMAANAERCTQAGVTYYPYLEPEQGAGGGLLEALAQRACVIVSDDFPCFFLPKMVRSVAARLDVRFEIVDSNGLLPMRAASKVFSRAFDFRRWLQNYVRPHLDEFPAADPLADYQLGLVDIPQPIAKRWPAAQPDRIVDDPSRLAGFDIDHTVAVSPIAGGSVAASQHLKTFVTKRLDRYAEDRNDPDDDVASGLSPYLHFGHISAHEVFHAVTKHQGWKRSDITGVVTGSNTGWWGASPALEGFLDQLVTWRELGYNFCWQRADYDRYESLPGWAQSTLAAHARDKREHHYSLEQLSAAETYDDIWNAAQRQLVREGKIHNYLRMLWGKKILEWTDQPRTALKYMIELNNRYGLDGRNPNSYSGIFWILGRYDRAWGPERPIFGTIRYMSSDSTRRKLKLKRYLARYTADEPFRLTP